MDGTRALRKRKSTTEETHEAPGGDHKRRRASSVSEVGSNVRVAHSPRPSTSEGANGEVSRGGRPKRQLKAIGTSARTIYTSSSEPRSLIISIPISAAALDTVEKNAQKKQKRRERDRERRARANPRAVATYREEPQAPFPAVATTMYSNPFYAFPDREVDELKGKPFGGILTDAEADTTKTYPQQSDRELFEAARRKAEEDWRMKTEAQVAETTARPKAMGPPSKIKCINFGNTEIDTWHAAPYPEEYSRNKVLYICEFCLKYMSSDFVAWRHKVSSRSSYYSFRSLTFYSSNVLHGIPQGTRYTAARLSIRRRNARPLFRSSKWMVGATHSTARTCVCSPSSFWGPRHYTTTSSHSCSM